MINECKDGVKGKKSEVIYVNKLYNRDTNTNTDTEICKISKMQDTEYRCIYYIIMNGIN